MKSSFLQIHPKDNVLVALTNLPSGGSVSFNGDQIALQENIPAKHKFFIHSLEEGNDIIMYGVLVGKAQTAIPKGGLMTTGNTKHAADPFEWRGVHTDWKSPNIDEFKNRTFNGYHRSDGTVGTANYWLFMPGCFDPAPCQRMSFVRRSIMSWAMPLATNTNNTHMRW